jgi:hypothetical protein
VVERDAPSTRGPAAWQGLGARRGHRQKKTGNGHPTFQTDLADKFFDTERMPSQKILVAGSASAFDRGGTASLNALSHIDLTQFFPRRFRANPLFSGDAPETRQIVWVED